MFSYYINYTQNNMNPYLARSNGNGRRAQPTHVDRITPTSLNNLDNRAMGISRLLGKTLLDSDYQSDAPIDTRFQSAGLQWSNNANQIRRGSVEDPDVGQFARAERFNNFDREDYHYGDRTHQRRMGGVRSRNAHVQAPQRKMRPRKKDQIVPPQFG